MKGFYNRPSDNNNSTTIDILQQNKYVLPFNVFWTGSLWISIYSNIIPKQSRNNWGSSVLQIRGQVLNIKWSWQSSHTLIYCPGDLWSFVFTIISRVWKGKPIASVVAIHLTLAITSSSSSSVAHLCPIYQKEDHVNNCCCCCFYCFPFPVLNGEFWW